MTTLIDTPVLSIQPTERENVDAAWLAEVRRRDATYRAGTVAARPVDKVMERLRKKAV